MEKPWRYVLVYLWTLPNDIIAWLTVLFVWLCWGTKLQWIGGLWCEIKPQSWPAQSWYRIKRANGRHILNPLSKSEQYGTWRTWGGTCLGHGGFYGPGRTRGPGVDTGVEYHEHVHVEQSEVIMLVMFLEALGVFTYLTVTQDIERAAIVGLIIWLSGIFVNALCGWIVAWMRGEDPYRGSTHEESAYAQTEVSKDES